MNDSNDPPPTSRSHPIVVRHMGRTAYHRSHAAMRAYTAARNALSSDQIWLLEHPPVYTLGQTARREHLLRESPIELIETERGGQITFHGPGQVIAYVLVDLKRRGIKVREFVVLLEDAIIATLALYNVVGQRKPNAPGVYVRRHGELEKIGALGLKVVKGCTFHGLSLNVAMDLTPFESINACGYPGLRTVDLATLGVHVLPQAVADSLARLLMEALAEKGNGCPTRIV